MEPWEWQPEPGGVLDSRPKPRGLNRLIPTGRRRAAREQVSPPGPSRPAGPSGRLTVELVPKTSWCSSIRALVGDTTWDRIRRQVWRRADYRCEVCGGGGPEHPVECHEVWRYDDRTRVQTLVEMTALCPDCYQVKLLGLASARAKSAQARAHLARVNGWTLARVDAHIAEAFRLWAQRSHEPWIVNLEGLRPYVPGNEYARIARSAAVPPARRTTER